jgi:hypothetical protein
MRTFVGVHLVALGLLGACGLAAAQIISPPVAEMPTTILQPPAGYPPTTATTAVGPYLARPAWGQTLPSNTRFVVLSNLNSDAVLDRETALVWARRFVSIDADAGINWFTARSACEALIVGNRGGWRLPTVAELRTLFDFSLPDTQSPRFPAGHPFALVFTDSLGSRNAWSETPLIGSVVVASAGELPRTDTETRRGQVNLRTGSVLNTSILDEDFPAGALCVRAAQ